MVQVGRAVAGLIDWNVLVREDEGCGLPVWNVYRSARGAIMVVDVTMGVSVILTSGINGSEPRLLAGVLLHGSTRVALADWFSLASAWVEVATMKFSIRPEMTDPSRRTDSQGLRLSYRVLRNENFCEKIT
jgi:hypothetical protein